MKAADETGIAQAPAAGFDPEWNLLLAACSALPVSEKMGRIRALAQAPIRWNALFALADRHGVSCLLHQALSGSREAVPAAEMLPLNRRHAANLHKVLFTARELFRILDCLDSQAIEVMPYKGLALAEMLYCDVAARQSGDIDLLIHARDLARVKNAVADIGYSSDLILSPKQERAYLVSGYEYTFDSAAGKHLLEVQWALQPGFYAVDFDMEGLFRRAVSLPVAGRLTKTPSPQDLVPILSLHAAKHMWMRLIWLCDISRLLQLPEVHWEWVEGQARALGMVRILRVTLLLAQRLLQAPIPDALERETAKDRESQALAESIHKQIASGVSLNVESWPYFRATMRLRERRRDQARFLWRLALTPGPGEWKSIRLPAPLFPLYGLVRLSRVAARLLQA